MMVRMTSPKQPGLAFRIFVSIGVCVYIFAATVWVLPSSKLRDKLYAKVAPLMMYSGLWQNFAVFSPDPKFNNMYLSAVVTCADGSTHFFEYPRTDKMPVLDRVAKERFRKYGLDNLYWDGNSMLWADEARFVARQYADKAPVLVSLQRHWQDIPEPSAGLGKPLPDPYDVHTYFVHEVVPEDLK